MAVSAGPNLVEDGLVLCLDAANSKSYPGTGTTWTDLSGNGNNGTLTNGPTYSGNNLGSISFDGVDDYVTLPSSLGLIFDNFCYDFWFLPQTTHQIDGESTAGIGGVDGQRYMIWPAKVGQSLFTNGTDAGVSVGTNGVSVYEHADNYMPALLVHETTINTIANATINYVNRQPFLYLNGKFIKAGLTSTRSRCYPSNNIGGSAGYGHFPGNLYIHRIYNRALSADEINQNFNALRGRYGI